MLVKFIIGKEGTYNPEGTLYPEQFPIKQNFITWSLKTSEELKTQIGCVCFLWGLPPAHFL